MRVDLAIDAKNAPIIGRAKTYPFVVQAKSLDASGFVAASDGVVKLAPRFSIWALFAAGGIALSVLIILVLAILSALNPPEPLIKSISLNASQIAQGDMLEITVDAEHVESFDVLVNQSVVQSALPGARRPARAPAAAGALEYDEGLFERLRLLRRRVAAERRVPPYLIFGDRTLQELSAVKPTSLGQLRGIRGIGDVKARDLGPVFVAEIAAALAGP